MSGSNTMLPTFPTLNAGYLFLKGFQNNGTAATAVQYVTFAHVFQAGQCTAAQGLNANFGSGDVLAQVDVKNTWPVDGSTRHCIITVQVPAIAAGGTTWGQFKVVNLTAATPLDIATVLGSTTASAVLAPFAIPDWAPNTAYPKDSMICPTSNNADKTIYRVSYSAPPGLQGWVSNGAAQVGFSIGASDTFTLECTTAGTSGATQPNFTNVPGTTFTDGTAVWTVQATETGGSPAWTASHAYAVGALINVSASFVVLCTTAGNTGTTEPHFVYNPGQTYIDGSVTWTGQPLLGTSGAAPPATWIPAPMATYAQWGSATALAPFATGGAVWLAVGHLWTSSLTVDLVASIKSATADPWLSGPLCSQARFSTTLKDSLRLVCDVSVFADNTVLFDVQFCNDIVVMQTVTGHLQYGLSQFYTATLSVNGTTVYTSPNLNHHLYENWTRIVGTAPGGVFIIHDPQDFIDAQACFPYDLTIGVGSGVPTGFATFLNDPQAGEPLYDPQNTGGRLIDPDMGAVGGRDDIGYNSFYDTAWFVTQDPGLDKISALCEIVQGNEPWHYYDPVSDSPYYQSNHPGFSLYEGPYSSYGAGTIAQMSCEPLLGTDWAHFPDIVSLRYTTQGRRYLLDELNYVTSWVTYGAFSAEGLFGAGNVMLTTQMRATGWGLRNFGFACFLSVDGSAMQAEYHRVLNNNLYFAQSWIGMQMMLEGGPDTDNYGAWALNGGNSFPYFAYWEMNYMLSAVTMIALQGHDAALEIAKFCGHCLISLLTTTVPAAPALFALYRPLVFELSEANAAAAAGQSVISMAGKSPSNGYIWPPLVWNYPGYATSWQDTINDSVAAATANSAGYLVAGNPPQVHFNWIIEGVSYPFQGDYAQLGELSIHNMVSLGLENAAAAATAIQTYVDTDGNHYPATDDASWSNGPLFLNKPITWNKNNVIYPSSFVRHATGAVTLASASMAGNLAIGQPVTEASGMLSEEGDHLTGSISEIVSGGLIVVLAEKGSSLTGSIGSSLGYVGFVRQYFAVAAGTTMIVSAPSAGWTPGNLLVASVSSGNGQTVLAPPAGWTLVGSAVGVDQVCAVLSYVVPAPAPSSVSFISPNGASYNDVIIAEFAGNVVAGVDSVSTGPNQTTLVYPAVAVHAAGEPILYTNSARYVAMPASIPDTRTIFHTSAIDLAGAAYLGSASSAGTAPALNTGLTAAASNGFASVSVSLTLVPEKVIGEVLSRPLRLQSAVTTGLALSGHVTARLPRMQGSLIGHGVRRYGAMRGDWVQMSASQAAASQNPAQLAPESPYPSFASLLGTQGVRLVQYSMVDTAGNAETGLGNLDLDTLLLTRSNVLATWDGVTYRDVGAAPLTTFTGPVTVRCGSVARGYQPSLRSSMIVLTPGISGIGNGFWARSGTPGSFTAAAGTMVFFPFLWEGTRTIGKATLEITTPGGSPCPIRLGIYEISSDSSLLLIEEFTSYAQLDGTLTGAVSAIAPGSFDALTLPPDAYMIGLLFPGSHSCALAAEAAPLNTLSSVLGADADGAPYGSFTVAGSYTILPQGIPTGTVTGAASAPALVLG